MKRGDSGSIIFSASDLMRFQGCRHATALDLAALGAGAGDASPGLRPAEASETAKLLQKKGDAHERAYLQDLAAAGIGVHEIETKRATFASAHAMTIAALRSGAPVIYQAALAGSRWAGYADFLERVERPSELGAFSYEVIDTKLKRTPAPAHVLQLAVYSDLLADAQGLLPAQIHVVLGDGRRATLPLGDYIHYARNLRRQLESFVATPTPTRPEPCEACSQCTWRAHCDADWEATDSLVLVAGIRKVQRQKLEAAGVTTLADLAARETPVPSLAAQTHAKLREQALLQHARRAGGPPAFKLRPPTEPEMGLARLPKPDAGDLFFDMEGDPLIEGGLEYLFGVYVEGGKPGRFRAFWAHTAEEEREATRAVLDCFDAHLAARPGAYIYHYNHYEVTALKRLVARHGVGEAKLDRLLREQRFVDLYRVASQGIVASEPGYSIKDLEVFYAPARTEEVTSAGDSIVVYEHWRETGDPALLDAIRAYNEVDCRSTKGLRDWLVRDVRPQRQPWWAPKPVDPVKPGTAERMTMEEGARDTMRQRLQRIKGPLAGAPAELLFELMWFHKREDKPQWWAMFDRAQRETEDLIGDLDCLAGLEAIGSPWPEKQSVAQTYRYPEQETKLRADAQVRAKIDGLPTVTILRLDAEVRTVDVKFGPSAGAPVARLDLIPGGPIGNEVLREAIARVGVDAFEGGGRYAAIEAVLTRALPRIDGHASGAPIVDRAADLVAASVDVITRLCSSYLPIQGPPGTGKTYLASHAILALLKAGSRVAVTSSSHKAIDNLMLDVARRAREAGFALDAIKKADEGEELQEAGIDVTRATSDPRLASCALVAGTAWLFARPEHDQAFDTLFVDEAGQVSLANLVAAGSAARNIVLIGDPMQLAQPIQGMHPGQSGASALGYVLGDAPTVAAERGVFLAVSRRMHPSICRYISDVVYEGRLQSDPGTAQQAVMRDERWQPWPGMFPPAGILFEPMEHEGDSQSSEAEAEVVCRIYRMLLGREFRDRDGVVRKLGKPDILVVTPYNAQVNLLTRRLLPGARIGTVDKFQGQEAPVCLVSMTTSSAEELPRNIEFLFSVNRLNVAISRAQALVVVLANTRLLDVPCRTVEQMRLVNALCAVAAYGGRIGRT